MLAAVSAVFSDSLLSSLTAPVLSTLVQGSRDLAVARIMKDDSASLLTGLFSPFLCPGAYGVVLKCRHKVR